MSNTTIISQNEKEEREKSFVTEFLSLIKIGIVYSNVFVTFTGLFLAIQWTGQSFIAQLDVVIVTLLGASLIIAGSAAMNNWIDRDIDPFMDRTKDRPTVSGRFDGKEVFVTAMSLLIIGEAMLFFIGPVVGWLGLVGIVSYVVVYSMWSKRRHVSNTIVGSISGAVPPVLGWAAIQPELGMGALALFLIMFVWQPPHFYALAMRRAEEYRAANIPMLPVVKGMKRTKWSIVGWVILLFPLPFLLTELGVGFLLVATALNIGWLYFAIRGLIRPTDDHKWATSMFVYSINYMMILFLSINVFAIFM